MTAFPTPELPQLPALATVPRKVRALAVDSAVAENRRNTLPADAEKRATPRLSIAELNASSLDDIRERWARTRVDDRGPLTRFLDLLDLPRNTIATILAPGVAARKKASGETGALGMGTVRTADILDDLGVDNRVVRGVAGFVGDVALDPLTYAGPAGWGAKLTGTARAAKGLGATVQITKRGLKAARSAIENPVSATGDIGEWLKLSGATTREAAHAAMGGNLRAQGVGAKAWRFLGDDISQGGSKLIDDAMTVLPEDPAEWAKLGYSADDVKRIQAAKRFVTAHNRAAQPGIRIGRNAAGRMGVEATLKSGPAKIKAGTQWLHIPFTDYALSGPAVSSAARAGLRNERVVQNAFANAEDMAKVEAIKGQVSPIIERLDEIQRRADSYDVTLREIEKGRAAAQARLAAGDPTAAEELARIDAMLVSNPTDPTIVDMLARTRDDAKAASAELSAIINKAAPKGPEKLSEAAQLYVAQHVIPGLRAKANEAAARLKAHNADKKYIEDVYRNGIKDGGVSMKSYIDKRVADSVDQQRTAHDAAEAARVAAHPEVDFTRAEGGSEIGVGELGTSGKAARGKSETDFLADDPADKLGGVWTGGTNPHKVVRTSDPLNFTPELADAEAKVYANAPREDVDRRFLLGLANKMQSGRISGMNPAKLNVGDSWTIGEYTATVHHTDDSGVILKLTKPDTMTPDGIAIPHDPRYYALDKNRTIPADPNTFARAGGVVEPRPYPNAFDAESATKATAAKEWTDYRAKIEDDWIKQISEMTDEGIDARAAHADILQDIARANEEWAASVNAPLVQAMRTDDLVARDIAALAVGANPEELGGNPLASMAAVAEALGRKFDNKNARDALDVIRSGVGKVFGNKSPSTAHDIARAIGSANDMRSELVTKITAEITNDVNAIAQQYGVKASDVDSLMTVLIHADEMPVAGDPLYDDLQDLVKKGVVDPTDPSKKELYNAIKEASARAAANLDMLANLEMEAGRLGGKLREKYGFSNVVSPEARQVIRSQKANRLLGGDAENAAKAIDEYYTKRRGTIEHTVRVGDKDVKFNDGDRVYKTLSKDTLDGMEADPAWRQTALHIREKLKAIDAYDAVPPGTHPPGRAMSPVEINRRAMDGEYSALTGGVRTPIMVESARVAAGYRFFAAERAKLAQQAMEFVKPHILPVNSQRLAEVSHSPNGDAAFRTHNGLQGHLFKNPNTNVYNLRIGDTVYRQPNITAKHADLWNPAEALGNEDLLGFMPDRLATMIENLVNVGNSEKDVLGVVKLIEATTKLWKASTLLHPSWTLNDTIGNVIFMLTMGITPAEITKNLKAAFKVAWANQTSAEKLPQIKVPFRGGEVTADNFVRAGVQKAGIHSEAIMQVMGNQVYDTGGAIRVRGKQGVKDLWDLRTREAVSRAQGQMVKDLPLSKKLAIGGKMFLHDGVAKRIWEPWVRMNGVANDWMRTTAYMALLERGMDPTSAARAVAEGMLDMGDLTEAEKKFRAFLPFFSWTKASGVYAVKQLFQNPKFYTTAPHAKRAIEETINGDERIPEHMRPQWMRDAMSIQFGTDPESRKFFLAQQALPNEAGAYITLAGASPVLGAEAAQDAAGYFGNMLTPLLKAPLEIGTKREWFSGRTIGPEGDVTVPEHLAGQIRLAKEFGVGTGVRAGGIEQAYKSGGIAAALARAMIGGRIQPGDERRLTTGLQRTAQEKETGLRRRIALAEREGDKEASLQARVQLLRHYAQMEQKGLKIPKWAEKQVQEVGQ